MSFFENAGGSYACRYVIWRLHRFYKERKVQPYAPYPASQVGGAEMDQARERLARVLGVANEEVCFGPSTSANTFVLANAVRQWLRGKDAAIVVTDQDHEANSGPWRRLAEEGIEVRVWGIDRDTGNLNPERLKPLLDDKVRLVCFPHCSNVVGEINDVARITRMVHAAGAFVCVDGVSYAPHGLPNVGKLNADIYMFSAYKTYGPHQGIMVIRHRIGDHLPNQGHYFNATTLWKRFTPAGPDHAQVAASAGMADYIDAVYAHHTKAGRDQTGRAEAVHDLFRAHEEALLAPLMDYLGGRNDIRILGPRTLRNRAPTIAIELDRPGEEAATALADHGIMAGGGDFYAVRPLEAMGVDPGKGVLRLSFVHYTSPIDIDRLITALDEVL
jgi:selenocysteine lyase/cysteine desulfurase